LRLQPPLSSSLFETKKKEKKVAGATREDVTRLEPRNEEKMFHGVKAWEGKNLPLMERSK